MGILGFDLLWLLCSEYFMCRAWYHQRSVMIRSLFITFCQKYMPAQMDTTVPVSLYSLVHCIAEFRQQWPKMHSLQCIAESEKCELFLVRQVLVKGPRYELKNCKNSFNHQGHHTCRRTRFRRTIRLSKYKSQKCSFAYRSDNYSIA